MALTEYKTVIAVNQHGSRRWECSCGAHGAWSLFSDHNANAEDHLKRVHGQQKPVVLHTVVLDMGYEGIITLGIYSTRAKAEEALAGSSYTESDLTIREMDLDGPLED